MRRAIGVFLIAAAALASPTRASAQVSKNLNEISIGTGLFEGNKFDVESQYTKVFVLRTAYGRFLTDRVEAGPMLLITKISGSDSVGNAGAFLDYHFGNRRSTTIPFAEVSLRRGFGDPDSNPVIVGAAGGMKLFVGKGGGAIAFGPFYNFIKYDKTKKGDSYWSELGVQVSLGKYF